MNRFNIHEEQWYNILLNTDLDYLKTTCLTNKKTKEICENNQFWIDKGLPIDMINLSHKIIDRIKLVKIKNIVDDLIQLFYNELTKEGVYIFIFDDNDKQDVNKLLPFWLHDIQQLDNEINLLKESSSNEEDYNMTSKFLIKLFENCIILQYGYDCFNTDIIGLLEKEVTMNQLKNFLIRLLFYNPYVNINDIYGYSFIWTKDFVNYKNKKLLTDRYNYSLKHDLSHRLINL